MILTEKNIRAVTAQGVTYFDTEGIEHFIDFQECYENYVNSHTNSSAWQRVKELNNWTEDDRENYVSRINRSKTVGDRNIMTPPWADGPFIEFYTTPPLRFKFVSLDEWHTVIQSIRHAGWVTFDLS